MGDVEKRKDGDGWHAVKNIANPIRTLNLRNMP
jgi:hypothetical protein